MNSSSRFAGAKALFGSLVAISLLSLPATAGAAGFSGGGLGAKGDVGVADVTCLQQCVDVRKATYGGTVQVSGVAMEQVREVVFRGPSGPIAVAPASRTESTATAVVPEGALDSRPYVIDLAGKRSERSPHKLFVLPPTAIPSAIYPIRGPHQLWDGFGGARNHQGADVGAACGTPLVAALPGRISHNEYHGRAGNYIVIDVKGIDVDLAYMHLTDLSPLKVGTVVNAGQPVGTVGDSGNASGCHLHFEYWVGAYWRGGEPVDPVPYLKGWEGQGAAKTKRSAKR